MAADSNDDELAKRANEDLVKTEDLLAGFDRPGRTPRMPATRDFVDYHLDKRRPPEARPAPAPAPVANSRDMPTAIIPHATPRWRVWLPWAVVLVALPVAGFLVLALLDDSTSRDRPAASPTLPTTSITRTSSAAPPPTTGPERDIPPPSPPSAAVTTGVAPSPPAPSPVEMPRRAATTSTGASPTAPITATALPPASAAPSAKPAPNGELIRVY